MLQLVAEQELKLAALNKEGYANFNAAIAGAPAPKLWDLLEAAFGVSNSEDEEEEEDQDMAPSAKRPRSEPPSTNTSAVAPKSTMPGTTATASTTPQWPLL